MEGLTTSSNSSKKSFNHTAKGILGSVSAGLEEEEEPPTHKAAAADPRGPFTAAAAEAGKKVKNARLHSERQPQTQRAHLQQPPPRLAAVKSPSWPPAMLVLM